MTPSSQLAAARIIRMISGTLENRQVDLIAHTLKGDGVMAFPTDTFYGLGASVFSAPAVQRICRIKKREESKPMPVLVSDIDMAIHLAAEIPPLFGPISVKLWPGPLTVVLRATAGLPSALLGAGQTIGIRLPNVPWLRDLIRQAGFPVTATSANISGAGEIDSAEEVIRQFSDQVDVIIDGGQTPGGRPSTVVDLTGKRPLILRPGAVTNDQIQRALG